MLAIALLILLDTGRPVFFRQRRVGKDGAPFTMLKFRTMVADAEALLPRADRPREARGAGLQDPPTTRASPAAAACCAAPASTSCRS